MTSDLPFKNLRPLHLAVAQYLYMASKNVPDGEAALYRAAALALMNEDVDAGLLAEAEKRKTNDDPLYNRADLNAGPHLEEVWEALQGKDGGPKKFGWRDI